MTPDDLSDNVLNLLEVANCEGSLHDCVNRVTFMLRSLGNAMDLDTDDDETFTLTVDMACFMALVTMYSLGVECYNAMFAEDDSGAEA